MEATACSPPPSPPSPTPRLRLKHWHIHAGGPGRSVEITIQKFSRTSATSGRTRWRHRGGAEAEETRGKTPVSQREGCRHKIIRFQGEERETQHCEAALRSEIPSSGTQKNTWFLTHQTAEHVGKQEFSQELRSLHRLQSFQWIQN